MELFLASAFVLVLGVMIGSFLNVVILRLNTGFSLQGRSRCLSCASTLAWFDLIPLASYFALGRRCRSCKSIISWQYPVVEAASGALFLLTFLSLAVWRAPAAGTFLSLLSLPTLTWSMIFLYWLVWSAMLVIVVYDIRHAIIPDICVYILVGAALFRMGVLFFANTVELSGIPFLFAGGPALALPFALIWFFSRGRAMGFGDVKLAFSTGLLFGVSQSALIFVFSFWIGALAGLLLLSVSALRARKQVRKTSLKQTNPRITMKSEVPFAPFFALAIVIVFLCDIDFSYMNTLFSPIARVLNNFPLWR